jgi:DNA integrity scanning protein DisA with diadenylate cyclase activity
MNLQNGWSNSLSGDLKKILIANAQLIPSSELQLMKQEQDIEQQKELQNKQEQWFISVSQRRNIILFLRET